MTVLVLWILTGLVFLITLLAAFAVPSWPVLALLLLAITVTFVKGFSGWAVLLRIGFGLGLSVFAYDLYELANALRFS